MRSKHGQRVYKEEIWRGKGYKKQRRNGGEGGEWKIYGNKRRSIHADVRRRAEKIVLASSKESRKGGTARVGCGVGRGR